MARFESGEFRLSSSWNSIEEMVGSAVRLSKRVLASRTLTTKVPAGLPLVKCDAVLIERVLVNLLENAAKYTPADAIVEVVAESAGDAMRVTVADNGPGIRPGTEQEIFNKFSRGVRESATSGVGLGLAICKAIIEAHGGTISVTNRAERGAAFTFTLPASEAQPLAPDIDEPGASE
jgi:two-component system sensor histidine kinase KdpD